MLNEASLPPIYWLNTSALDERPQAELADYAELTDRTIGEYVEVALHFGTPDDMQTVLHFWLPKGTRSFVVKFGSKRLQFKEVVVHAPQPSLDLPTCDEMMTLFDGCGIQGSYPAIPDGSIALPEYQGDGCPALTPDVIRAAAEKLGLHVVSVDREADGNGDSRKFYYVVQCLKVRPYGEAF